MSEVCKSCNGEGFYYEDLSVDEYVLVKCYCQFL